MSLHIHRFIDRVQGQDARGGRDLVLTITEAKDLLADITRLLLDLEAVRSAAVNKNSSEETITVQMDGGSY
jgi:hypothetical protein